MLSFLANMGNAVRVGILLAILSGVILYWCTQVRLSLPWSLYTEWARFIWICIMGAYVCLVVLAQLIEKNRAA